MSKCNIPQTPDQRNSQASVRESTGNPDAGVDGNDDYFDDDDDDDIDELVKSPFPNLDTPMSSKITDAEYRGVEDEQIIGTALMLLLDTLVMDYRNAKGSWRPYRQPFFVTDGARQIYQTRVDGVYRLEGDKEVKIIMEVKASSRHKGGMAVDMQESAQMAAWIAATTPQPAFGDKKAREAPLPSRSYRCNSSPTPRAYFVLYNRANMAIRRAIISQNRRQIWITLGTYDDDYIEYISGRDTKASKDPFLTMTRYGPFSILDNDHIKVLCHILLALSVQGKLLDKVQNSTSG